MSAKGPRQEEQDTRFMMLALKQAETAASLGQTPFGAVVVDRDGNLVGEGHNTVRANLDPTAHGEIAAIRAAWRRVGAWQMLSGSTSVDTAGATGKVKRWFQRLSALLASLNGSASS